MNYEFRDSENERMTETNQNYSSNQPNYLKLIGIIALVIVMSGLGFVGGMTYQKGKNNSPTDTAGQFGQPSFQAGNADGMGGPSGGQRPNIGEVTAVSSTSITISSAQSGSDQTFNISSATTVDSDGATGAVSDIKTGDTVLIQTDSSDSTTVTKITLNPSFQGPPSS